MSGGRYSHLAGMSMNPEVALEDAQRLARQRRRQTKDVQPEKFPVL